MSRILTLLLLASAVVFSANAQSSTKSSGIDVTAIFHEDDPTSALKWEILSVFKNQLSLRGVSEEGNQQHRWLIEAQQISPGGESLIVLSVTRMEGIPNSVIDFGAENEAYYLQTATGNLPAEGRVVRKAFSRDWLEQFYNVFDQNLFVISPADLERTVSEYVDRHLAE